ncbi:MAG: hypothetical protein M9893_09415 [Pyrinomonadaceae bacterium]|nr:hypothetical protein [Pyrinomonadaceae bacterium]
MRDGRADIRRSDAARISGRRVFRRPYKEVETPEWATAGGLALYSMRSQIHGRRLGSRSAGQKVAQWIDAIRDKFR